jgi:hypothetical protein
MVEVAKLSGCCDGVQGVSLIVSPHVDNRRITKIVYNFLTVSIPATPQNRACYAAPQDSWRLPLREL